MKKIIYILILFFMFIPSTLAKEDNLVNIYLFYSNSCLHCHNEIKLLDELEDKYSNIRIYKYEVSNSENNKIFTDVSELLNTKVSGVPFTVIGNRYYNGFSIESSKKLFLATIEYYSKYGYKDVVGEYLNKELPTYNVEENQISVENYIKEYGNYKFKLPVIGTIETNDLSLSLTALILGLIDRFNYYSILMMFFLLIIYFFMIIKDRKQTFILGGIFLLTSLITYFIFILPLSNLYKILISIILLILTMILIIRSNIKKYNKNIYLSLTGTIILAILVNIIKFTYFNEIPTIFKDILYINNITKLMEIPYILIYIFTYFVLDIIIFIIIISNLKLTKSFNKYI